MVKPDFSIIRLNKSMANFLGKTFQECIGKQLEDIFGHLDHQLFKAKCDLVFTAGRTIQVHDHPMLEKGRKGWFEITFYPILENDQNTKECVMYFKNITELFLTKRILLEQYKRLEEQQIMVENKNALLIEVQKSLDKTYQSLMDELSIAQEVQRGTMPTHLPRIPGLDFFASYEPISQVGGDIYDVIDLGNDKIGIFIGDVSGHGLAPAFVAAMVKMALIDHAYSEHSPREVFSIINKNMNRHLKSGHYLTAFYGILDLSNNNFTYSKASHPNPVLIRRSGEIKELETGGMFLGLVDNPGYEEKSVLLNQGDRLYLFTDGYYEIKDKEGKLFSFKKLKQIIQSINHLPKKEAFSKLQEITTELTGENEPEDDKTFLIFEITGKGRELFKSPLLKYFTKEDNVVVRQYSTESGFEQIFSEFEEYYKERIESDELRSKICLCVIELSNNAIEHGNKYQLDKVIQLAYSITRSSIKIAFRDEGEGFSPENLEDPRNGENWRKERGRGIFIVKSYMDEVHFNRKGNMVTAIKFLSKGVR